MKSKTIFLTLVLCTLLQGVYAQGKEKVSDWEGIDWEIVTRGEIQTRLDAGAVNATDNIGNTALIYATRYNLTPKIITTLIDAGADVNATDTSGLTALMRAARYNSSPEMIITALINAGADVNATTTSDRLIWYFPGDNFIPEFVLNPGSNDYGHTALMYAAYYTSNPEVIATLIVAGADINVTNNSGETAFDWAIDGSNWEIAAILEEYGAKRGSR